LLAKDFKAAKDVKVLRLDTPKGRVIAIGDVHGCISELKELLEKVGPTKDDLLVFVGDLIDRGPDSEGVVQLVKSFSEACPTYNALGNHDEKVVRYHYHQMMQKENPAYKVPMRCPGSYNELSNSSLEFLNQMPHAVFIDGTPPLCFVHAGLSPALFKQPPNAFIRNRYFTKNVHTNQLTPVKSIEIDDVWFVPEGSYPWHYYWDGRWTVVYGHSVNEIPLMINNTIGIDGGCCFGGCLRAWVKVGENSYFVDVPAKVKDNHEH
jgi:diadenosine tetraphosphatase ApaH/serine/threonine PP2A family protein phosphatase